MEAYEYMIIEIKYIYIIYFTLSFQTHYEQIINLK